MSKKDVNKAIEMVAKPFEEKFRKLGVAVEATADDIRSDVQGMHETQRAINDNFDGRITGLEKKQLFTINTKYDIKNEDVLSREEQEYLVSYLFTCSSMLEDTSDAQKKFMRSVTKYLEVGLNLDYVDLSCVENIKQTKGVQAFYQTVMEFLFLNKEDFSFEEMFEEVLDLFAVINKVKKEIKNQILNIYKAVGAEGIAEKYGYEPEKDNVQINELSVGENENTIKYYDGNDICKKCADRVNINSYIELDDYVIMSESKGFFGGKKILRISKKTGEEIELDFSMFTNEYEEGINSFFADSGYTMCGYGNIVYVQVYVEGKIKCISSYNVENFEVQQYHVCVDCKKLGGINANDKYIVFIIEKNGRKCLICFDMECEEIIEVDQNVSINPYHSSEPVLINDKIFYMSNVGHACYEYDIISKKRKLIEESLDYAKTYFLGNPHIYDNILYDCYNDVKDDSGILFVDVRNPLSIQKIAVPQYGKKYIFCGYGKAYYITMDKYLELGYVDIKTKECVTIKNNVQAIGSYEEGTWNKKTIYTAPTNIQVVGKWIYYRKGMLDRVECIECNK